MTPTTAAFNTAAFRGEVVDWAVITDWDLVAYDRGIVARVEKWAELAVRLHGATTITAMRDYFGFRYLYVATRSDL